MVISIKSQTKTENRERKMRHWWSISNYA